MEKPNFNNQPKTGEEKTPQANENFLNTEEKESSKRENITLEIDGQKIEAVKYYFEYPERIQKQTGILGYERVKITDKNFLNFYRNPQSEFGHENSYAYKIKKLLLSLSNKEYPHKCLNHFIGGFASDEQTKKYQQNLARDRFFLQKIYDVERISKEKDEKELFDHSGGSKFRVFRKVDNIQITEKLLRPRDIFDHQGDIGENIYLVSDEGLNVSPGNFWHMYSKPDDICFGFSPFEDDFMKDYFDKATSELILLGFSSENKAVETSCDISRVNKYIEKEGKDWLWKKPLSNIVGNRSLLVEPDTLPDRLEGPIDEAFMPIFIGHNEILQLSWGHAKYAHYFNDKSFNFFKFKHADHLPTKEVNSSDF